MTDPVTASYVMIAIAGAGAVQQVRVTNATNRVNQWQAKEEGRKAHLQSTQREVDRMQALRKTLAQNNANAAASGVSLTSETVTGLKTGSIQQFESDQLTDRVNTNSYIANLTAAARLNGQMSANQNLSTAINFAGSAANTYINANTKSKINSDGG